MAAQHVEVHNRFADVQQRLGTMKKQYGCKKLDVEVIQSTALDINRSLESLSKVMAFRHMQMTQVFQKLEEEERRLNDLQKETAKRFQALLSNRMTKKRMERMLELRVKR